MSSPFYVVVWAAGLCCLWALWDFAIKSFCLDLFRERLFSVRFSLFRLGMDGKIDFESEVYRQMETLLCGLLRFGHRVSFLTYIFSRIEQDKRKKEKDYSDVSLQIALKIKQLEPDAQAAVLKILDDTREAIFSYTAFTSLFFLIPFAGIMLLKLFGVWHPKKVAQHTSAVEWEAYRAEVKRPLRLATAY